MRWGCDGTARRSSFPRREQEGNIIVLTAIMMVVLLGLVALAIDIGHEIDQYRRTQNTSDASALAGAESIFRYANRSSLSAVQFALANAVVVTNADGFTPDLLKIGFLDKNGNPLSVTVTHSDGSTATVTVVSGTDQITDASSIGNPGDILYVDAWVHESVPTFFARVLGIGSASVATHARAQVNWEGSCQWCNMNTTGIGIDLHGNGNFVGVNVQTVVNSSASNALTVAGTNATFTDSGSNPVTYVVGQDSICTSCTVSPAPTLNSNPVPDPLSWVPSPSGTYPIGIDCNGHSLGSPPTKLHITGGGTCTLTPGVYGQIQDDGSATVILEPGIYILTGPFTGNSKAIVESAPTSMTGNVQEGVTFYTTCPSSALPYYTACSSGTGGSGTSSNNCTVSASAGCLGLAGSASVALSAPTTSQTSPAMASTNSAYVPWYDVGMLIFQDRQNQYQIDLQGSSSLASPSQYSGTIYAYTGQLNVSGGGAVTTGIYSYVVVGSSNFDGNGGGGSGSTFNMDWSKYNQAPLSTQNGLVQ